MVDYDYSGWGEPPPARPSGSCGLAILIVTLMIILAIGAVAYVWIQN